MPIRRLTERDYRQDGELLACVLKLLTVVSDRHPAGGVQGPLLAAHALVTASHTAVLARADALKNQTDGDTIG